MAWQGSECYHQARRRKRKAEEETGLSRMYNQYDEARKNQSQATDESKRQEGTSMCSCGCRISHVLCAVWNDD